MLIPNPDLDFFGKFGPKKSKLSVLTENWHTWYLGSANSESGLGFLKFQPKINFWANLGWKNQSCLFFLKIGTYGILTMLILIPTLAFWISDPKSIFGKIWAKKVKVVQFGRKLAHRVSRQCWFVFRHYFSQFSTLNPFLGKLGLKKSKLFVLPENWHTRTYTHSISKMLILISILVFSNFKPKSWGCWFLFCD